jgi:ABC-type glycerol-3-phosphate transport system substrate-binding protein
MKFAKHIIGLAGALALSSLVTAQQVTTPAECKMKAPSKPTTINVLGFRFPMMEYYFQAAEACSKVQNVTVKTSFLASDAYITQVNTALSTGSSPYQILHVNPRLIADWGNKGWLVPLDTLIIKYARQYGLDDISDALLDNGTLQGIRYAIPVNFNTQLLFYRKDVFSELDLKAPKTLEEFNATLEALKKAGKTKYPLALAMSGTNLVGEFHNNFTSLGGKWFDSKGRPIFNNALGLKAAQALRDWMQYMPPNVLTYGNDEVMAGLQLGDIAMSKIWLTRAAPMEDPKVSKVIGKIEYAPAFRIGARGANTAEGDMLAIAAKSGVDPDISFRVIMEMLNKANQQNAAKFGMVSRDSIANDPEYVKANRAWSAAAQNAKIAGLLRPAVPYQAIANTAVAKFLSAALANKTDIQVALDAAVKQTEDEMKAQGFLK